MSVVLSVTMVMAVDVIGASWTTGDSYCVVKPVNDADCVCNSFGEFPLLN